MLRTKQLRIYSRRDGDALDCRSRRRNRRAVVFDRACTVRHSRSRPAGHPDGL